MNHTKFSSLTYLFALGLFVCALLPTAASAGDNSLMGPSHRSGKWELNLTSQYIDNSAITFAGGSSTDLDGTLGWGFGFGYNFSEFLEINFDVNWSYIDYTANYLDENDAPQTAKGELSASSANVGLTYNFMPKRFTPFITGTIGWQYVNTDIASGPPVDGCWWYPWWGYICAPYQPTYSDDNFTYGALAGLRFDLGRSLYLKGSLGKQYLNTSHGGRHNMTMYRINLGWMF